jgi:outer membrane lipoprotein-sorting protein
MSKRLLATLMLLMSMVLAACAKEEITAENIVTKMQEAQRNTADMHAVARLDYTSRDESGFITAEYWMRKTGAKDEAGNDIQAIRVKVLEASEADAVGVEAVFNGDSGWLYSPKENTAYVGSKADMEGMRPEESNGGPASQTEMLMQLQGFVQQGLDAVNIEIQGEEQVAGANAYKLKITPKPEAQQQLQLPIELLVDITLWVDSARWMPVKLIVDAKDMGKVEIAAQTLEVNAGVDAAQFDAAPPAGATIVKIADMVKEHEQEAGASATTLDDARAQAGFTLLTAGEVNAGAALVDVQMIKLPQSTAVVQSFSGPGVEWSLVQSQGDFDPSKRDNVGGTAVDVRGVKGTLIEGKGNVGTLLTWEENGVSFVVAGNISADDAQKIAADLK